MMGSVPVEQTAGRMVELFQERPMRFGSQAPISKRPSPEDLVVQHMGLAKALARRFCNRGESREDLEQVALLALVRAARRFDPARQNSFSTYATVSVLGELRRHFRDKTWGMRMPRQLQENHLRVQDARDVLAQRLGASPTMDQIAEFIGTSVEQVLEAMEAGRNYRPESLDRRRNHEEGEPVDIPMDEGGYSQGIHMREVTDHLRGMAERDRLVLVRIYFEERTQRQIADELGISQMQVSRIHAGAIRHLRARVS
jgi:RNA polymerase sigma-B factor